MAKSFLDRPDRKTQQALRNLGSNPDWQTVAEWLHRNLERVRAENDEILEERDWRRNQGAANTLAAIFERQDEARQTLNPNKE